VRPALAHAARKRGAATPRAAKTASNPSLFTRSTEVSSRSRLFQQPARAIVPPPPFSPLDRPERVRFRGLNRLTDGTDVVLVFRPCSLDESAASPCDFPLHRRLPTPEPTPTRANGRPRRVLSTENDAAPADSWVCTARAAFGNGGRVFLEMVFLYVFGLFCLILHGLMFGGACCCCK
jgi:hypothetical protein